MKKKIIAFLLATTMIIGTTACGGTTAKTPADTETPEAVTATPEPTESPSVTPEDTKAGENNKDDETSSELKAIGDIEVEKELFDVTLTIPADYVGEKTQEELDADAAEYGYKVVLNDDGTATYTMTKSQHKAMLEDYRKELNTSLAEMVASEEYPNITDITANDNFTNFTVTTKSTELDMSESFSVMAFYMYGGIYNIFSGENVDNVHVDFVNADTGEIISSSDSSDMGDAQSE